MSETVRLSVLVPAFNEEELIEPTVRSVHDSFAALGRRDYEVVVCDNNSSDRTAARAAAAGARVVFEPHNQVSRARNAAARLARGEWLIFLDADTLMSRPLLEATLSRIESGRIGAGGALVSLDTERPGWFGAMFQWGWNRLSVARRLAPGSYIFCLRAAWEEVGGFDEDLYFLEDVLFSKKLRRWCRRHRRAVSIVTEARAVTSARKLAWYGGWRVARSLLPLFRYGSIRRREPWGILYERPQRGPADDLAVTQTPAAAASPARPDADLGVS